MIKRNTTPATREDVEKIVTKVAIGFSEAILEGVQQMFDKQNRLNSQTFATKEDLKREISWVRDDIKGLEADLVDTVSKKEFNQFRQKVDKHLVD